MFGLIMGSNFGANFTVVGALAGIMWVQILKDKGNQSQRYFLTPTDIPISYLQFAKYGFILMPLTVALASGILAIQLEIFEYQ
jgi:Na+/H+ antiporter NhaD/arsenite permease-like protein